MVLEETMGTLFIGKYHCLAPIRLARLIFSGQNLGLRGIPNHSNPQPREEEVLRGQLEDGAGAVTPSSVGDMFGLRGTYPCPARKEQNVGKNQMYRHFVVLSLFPACFG